MKHRKIGPAYVWQDASGTTVERYFKGGKQHREDGPALVKRFADGSTYEEYYREGNFVKEERRGAVASFPAVKDLQGGGRDKNAVTDLQSFWGK